MVTSWNAPKFSHCTVSWAFLLQPCCTTLHLRQEKSLGNNTPSNFFTEQMEVLQSTFSAVFCFVLFLRLVKIWHGLCFVVFPSGNHKHILIIVLLYCMRFCLIISLCLWKHDEESSFLAASDDRSRPYKTTAAQISEENVPDVCSGCILTTQCTEKSPGLLAWTPRCLLWNHCQM